MALPCFHTFVSHGLVKGLEMLMGFYVSASLLWESLISFWLRFISTNLRWSWVINMLHVCMLLWLRCRVSWRRQWALFLALNPKPLGAKQWHVIVLLLLDGLFVIRLPSMEAYLSSNRARFSKLRVTLHCFGSFFLWCRVPFLYIMCHLPLVA